ncbi:hypothetical protein GGR53DRAFT_511740 [Hypoxylon sp. FL1150]|nr:hypothetical protein GGR53DRAFT_511740 [Hypoxylon sp. FL1150]
MDPMETDTSRYITPITLQFYLFLHHTFIRLIISHFIVVNRLTKNPEIDVVVLEASHYQSRSPCSKYDHSRLSHIDDALRGTDGPVQASFPEEVEDPLPTAWVATLTTPEVVGVQVKKDGVITIVKTIKDVILVVGVFRTLKL